MRIIYNLKSVPLAIMAVASSLILFNISYYVMANFPGFRNNMCVIGAGLTPVNIVYSIIISIMAGVLIANIPQFVRIKTFRSTSSGFTGLLLGGFTIFCPLCTLPAISLFGISISLSFFTTYDGWIKMLSLILMIWSLYLVNKKLSCSVCKI